MHGFKMFLLFSVLMLSCVAATFYDDADWNKVREKRSAAAAAPVVKEDGQK